MTNDLNIFFKEVFQEFRKISWPSQKEFLINISGTFFIVFAFAIYLGFVDSLIGFLITKIINITL